jgi:hypothetical protein
MDNLNLKILILDIADLISRGADTIPEYLLHLLKELVDDELQEQPRVVH